MKKFKLLLTGLALLGGVISGSAQLKDGTTYWIQDVSTGQFISQGDAWATHAVGQDVGGLGFKVDSIANGVYKLQNIMWNTVKNATVGLGVDVYVDQNPAEWTLTASGDGYLISNGGNYLINNGAENAYKEKPIGKTTDASAATVWKFLTKTEYDAAIQAYKDGMAASYATSLGYTVSTVAALETLILDADQFISKDYTSSITNPTLGSNDTGWTHGRLGSRGNDAGGWAVGSGCAEFWNGCGYATQTVTGLPDGLYKVTFVGAYRPANSGPSNNLASEKTSSPAFVYANDAKVELLHWIDVPAKANGRSGITVANGYQNSFYTYVTNGTLALGVVADGWTGGYSWCTFGQFTLTYYSDKVSDEDATTILNTASNLADSKMGSGVKNALSLAVSNFEEKKTIANFNALNNAISNANASINSYAALQTAITDANNHTIYSAAFDNSISIYNNAVSAAQSVYDNAEVDNCTDAITALTNGIHNAYENDYAKFANDYPYDYSNLLNQDLTKWASSDYVVMTALEHWNGLADQRYYEQSGAEWGANAWSHAASETTILPAGHYVMSITARASAGVTSSMSVKAGDNEAITVTLPNKGAEGRGITTDGVGSYSDEGTYANTNGRGWEYRFIAFELEEESPVTISFSSSTNATHNWVSIAVPLLKGNVHPNQIELNQITHQLSTLTAYESQITAATYATFADHITAAQNATLESTDLDEIISNLQADIEIAKTEAEKLVQYNAVVDAIGENTNVDLTSFVVNAGFETGTMEGWTSVDGGTQANNKNFSKMSGEHFVERWKNGVALESGSLTHDALFLPKGLYTITAEAQNIEQYNSNAGGTGYFLCANDERTEIGAAGTYTTSVLLTEDQDLTIKFLLENCTGNWISCDNVTLTYVGEDFPEYTLVTGSMNAEIAAAQTTADETFQSSKTIANYNALTAAIEAAQASKDAYAAAATAIANAKDIQTKHNLATADAITTFADAIAAIENPYTAGTLADADANNAGKALGSVVTGWHEGVNSAAVKYMNDGFSLNDFDAALYVNTWSTEGEGDGSNFKVPFYEYFAGDGNSLGANTWTSTLTGLENGLYTVKALVRVRVKNEETAVGDASGISMNVNGGTAVDVTEGTQVGESRFQLAEYTAEGLVKDGTLKVNFVIDAENNIHWLSFKNVYYNKERDLNPEEMINWADEFAAAQQDADGVLDNEDYQNVTGSERVALNTAKNATPSNDEEYQAAITAIETAIENLQAAKANYDLLAAETAYAKSLGMTETAVGEFAATENSTAATVVTNVENLKVAEYTYVTNTYTQTCEVNAWTENFASDYNNEGYKPNGPTYWDQWGSGTFSGTQTITLPAGDYALSVIARGQAGSSGYLYYKIGEETIKADFAMKGNRGLGVDVNGVANFTPATEDNGIAYNCNNEGYGWEYRFLTFKLENETAVEIGVSVNVSSQWASAYTPLLLTTEASAKNVLLYEIAEFADNVPSGNMMGSVEDALGVAVTNAKAASSDNSVEELNTILNDLKTAIAAAETSISAYASAADALYKANWIEKYHTFASETAKTTFANAIAAIETPYNEGTLTNEDANNAGMTLGVAISGRYANPTGAAVQYLNDGFSLTDYTQTLYVNTWSTEGENDGTGFTVPFYEYWTGDDNSLAEKTWTATLTGLENGAYFVGIDVRVRAKNGEAADDATGITMDMNGGEKFFDDEAVEVGGPVDVTEGDVINESQFQWRHYELKALVKDGKLNLNVNIAADNNISWLSFKHILLDKYRDLTEDELFVNPTGIELDKTTATMATGETLSLTATVLPENADDKTVNWSSNNDAVAIVDANGVISAVGAGEATITATSACEDNVTATMTVTVTDAPAPTYYSEIAAGDFYIVNAGTGKFLGGANSWGTQASLIEHGIPFTAALNDGKYTLDSYTYNAKDSHFFNGTYVDGASTPLYITPLENGRYSISTADGSAFVTAHVGSTVVDNNAGNANASLAQWYFISKNDRNKMLADATAENPVDATYYINEANISRNLRVAFNTSGWTGDKAYGGADENQCVERYKAVTDVYQEITVPNGTYIVKVQGFYRQEGGEAVSYLYANDVEEPLTQIFAGGINDMAGASAAFSNGEYTTQLTVTVTDRKLKVGVKCDDATNWTIWDNFELYLTDYTPVTGVTANIDKNEITYGETVQITAATVPATASFNALTYTSSDENVATVDENGVVTGIAEGNATITVTANEMANFSTTVDVTVTLVIPTSLTLSETEVALDIDNTSATLTVASTTPAGANNAVTWSSSDESVATVANGIVTGISTGTATITATSAVAPEVTATATVTVTYPETTFDATTYVNNGATRSVCTLGENLIKNGSFEYANPYYGWTYGTGSTTPITSTKFDIITEIDADGNQYLQATTNEGGAAAGSLNTSWQIEPNKTYVFGYKVKSTVASTGNQYIGTSLNTKKGEENTKTKLANPAYNANEWTAVNYVFESGNNKWLVFNARWLANAVSFDDFYLAEAAYTLEGNVDYATAAIPTANIGTGAFQYSQDAINAANALVQGEATVAEVEAAYEALTTLNAPDADQLYNLVIATEGHSKNGNAVIIVPGTAGANNPTGYGLNANFAINPNLNQAVTFTKVSGNTYNISFKTAEGVTYLTYGANNGSAASWKNSQIQATTDETKKGEFLIAATATDNVFNIYNTITNSTIACQSGGNIYTEAGNADFSVAEVSKPSITINTTVAGWGTTILPFAVSELPNDVKAYTCATIDGKTLSLEEVDALEANKPYIIEGAWNETLTGDALGAALNYTEGLLTGVYDATPAPVNSYVLQKKNDKVAFYRVGDGENNQPTVGANRCFLTVNSDTREAFFLDKETTAINAVEALTNGDAEIYNAAGARIPTLQKGMNIIKSNGKSFKIFVK